MIKFSINPEEDYVNVNLEGDLDIDGTEVIEEELIPALKHYQVIKLDFDNVPFVDSSGIGLLMNVVHTLQDTGVKVTIHRVRDEVMDIFDLLQLPDILGDEVFVK